VVVIKLIAFQPADLTVAPGDTIEWQNQDLVPHTATATDRSWDSGDILPDRRWRWVATRAGTFAYACRYHTNMHGVVRIGS
jgi:plastocyanin